MDILKEGLEEKMAEIFVQKYPTSGIVNTPDLDNEIKLNMAERGRKKDNHLKRDQDLLGAAAVAL